MLLIIWENFDENYEIQTLKITRLLSILIIEINFYAVSHMIVI